MYTYAYSRKHLCVHIQTNTNEYVLMDTRTNNKHMLELTMTHAL